MIRLESGLASLGDRCGYLCIGDSEIRKTLRSQDRETHNGFVPDIVRISVVVGRKSIRTSNPSSEDLGPFSVSLPNEALTRPYAIEGMRRARNVVNGRDLVWTAEDSA